MNIRNIYESNNYKKLLILPIISVVICIFLIQNVSFGIDLSGGTLMTAPLNTDIDALTLEEEISEQFDLEDLTVRVITSITSEVSIQFKGERSLISAQEMLEAENFAGSIEISKTFTEDLNLTTHLSEQADTYYSKAREIFKNSLITFAGIKIGADTGDFSVDEVILIFYFFRAPIVAFAVIQAAFFDVMFGLAALGLLGIPLSMPTIAALLMLVGYSVDTDIMLTDRVIRRKEGTPGGRVVGAMKTGLTMTGTTLGAVIGLFVVASMTNIPLLTSISLVLVFGLIGDIISTWFTNAPLVLWHMERKRKRYSRVEM